MHSNLFRWKSIIDIIRSIPFGSVVPANLATRVEDNLEVTTF